MVGWKMVRKPKQAGLLWTGFKEFTMETGYARIKNIIEWGNNINSLSYKKCVDIINLYNDYIFEKNLFDENLENLEPLNLQKDKRGVWEFDLEASKIMVRFFETAGDKLLDDLLPQMEVEKSELEQFLSTFKGWIEDAEKAGTGDLVIDWF